MKIKISKSQWEEMGKKAGWNKKADFEAGYDRVNDLVDQAIHNPRLFREFLKDNPEICDDLDRTLQSQQRGYHGTAKGSDVEEMLNPLTPAKKSPLLRKKKI